MTETITEEELDEIANRDLDGVLMRFGYPGRVSLKGSERDKLIAAIRERDVRLEELDAWVDYFKSDGNYWEAVRKKDAEIAELKAEAEKLREALEKIANMHMDLHEEAGHHRIAMKIIARKALGEADDEQ